MSARNQSQVGRLTRLQQFLWYCAFAWFFLVCVLYLFDTSLAASVSHGGVVFVVVVTVVRIVALMEVFRRARLYRFWLLGCVLILVLISTILLKYFSW